MSSRTQLDIGERRAARHAGRSRASVFLAVGIFYLAAALLNGRHLHEDALKREYGPVRDIWVAATRPLHALSTALGLDRVRGAAETLRKE